MPRLRLVATDAFAVGTGVGARVADAPAMRLGSAVTVAALMPGLPEDVATAAPGATDAPTLPSGVELAAAVQAPSAATTANPIAIRRTKPPVRPIALTPGWTAQARIRILAPGNRDGSVVSTPKIPAVRH